ncbi:hypothetical protein HDU76_003008 [Blyttiomyces sp. JEL0837]|nr:hypothetical protein HDU76_003008 [Blyttiomyces sp. JEL0837]
MSNTSKLTIGVLALQGGFSEHKFVLQRITDRVDKVVEVRKVEQLAELDGLIFPGGESTTMALIAEKEGLLIPLREFVASGKPVWGTCAGMIMLSNEVTGAKEGGQATIGGLGVRVRRNAFGRQVDSFETNLNIAVLGEPAFHGVFIRAPVIEILKDVEVEVVARLPKESVHGDAIVGVRERNILATSFHPELTNDDRFHRFFLDLVSAHKAGKPEFKVLQRSVLESTLKRLIRKFVDVDDEGDSVRVPDGNGDDGDGDEEGESRINEIMEYCMRILSSRISASILPDEVHVADMIRKKLMRRNGSGSTESAAHFSNLHARLTSKKVIQRKWSILYFLLAVSDQNEFVETNNPLDSSLSVFGLKAPDVKPPLISQNSPARDDNPLPEDFDQSQPPNTTFRDVANKHYFGQDEVTERKLLRDVLYVFQGIDGTYVKFNAKTGAIELDSQMNLPISTMENLHRLGELGWLYRQIAAFANPETNNLDASGGLILQSFASAINTELKELFQLIAFLENQIDSDPNEDFVSKGLSLKRLNVWLQDPLHKFRLLVVLIEVCRETRGGALISMIHSYANHGDPFVQDFMERLLKRASRPFFEIVKRWIYEGELEDPFKEFFVVLDESAKDANIWRMKYHLKYDMVPSFISGVTAKRIYLIGKSLNFIRYCCQEEEYVVQRSKESSEYLEEMEYGHSKDFEETIKKSYEQISGKVLEILYEKYKLIDHFMALKKYLLLGQGDFVQNLMDKLGSKLSMSAHSIFRHNLIEVLESSIRSSNAQYDDQDLIRRLDVRLLQITSGDTGWDVFALDYHVTSPINTILNTQAMHQYVKLFIFLWRLKRVEHTLSQTWRRQIVMGSRRLRKGRDGGGGDLLHVFHRCNIIRNEMIHFTFELQYYLLFEVIEHAWSELVTFCKKRTGDLDQLIAAHNKYLNSITSRGLLASSQPQLLPKVIEILDTILEFEMFEITLERFASQDMDVGTSLDYRSSYLDNLNSMNLNFERPEPVTPAGISKFREQIDGLLEKFRGQLNSLLTALSSHSDTNLHGLKFRLDYNSFYHKK